MSAAPFPKTIDPLKMVDQRVDMTGQIALSQLDRLRDILLDNSGDVQVALRFGKDEEGIRFISGSLQSVLSLQCQRCLQPVAYTVESALSLGIVFSEEAAKNLPGYYDPLLLDTPELEVWQMVEEELILSLPIAARHPEGECRIDMNCAEPVSEQPRRPNPFQVLAKLKDDQ